MWPLRIERAVAECFKQSARDPQLRRVPGQHVTVASPVRDSTTQWHSVGPCVWQFAFSVGKPSADLRLALAAAEADDAPAQSIV